MKTISGQAFLPLDEEHAQAPPVKLSRKHEAFVMEYWRTGNKRQAYVKCINPDATPATVIKESNRLLAKNGAIRCRIRELQAAEAEDIRAEVTAFHRQALTYDVKEAFHPEGKYPLPVPQLPDDIRRLVSLEARVYEGHTIYVPVFASKEKAAAELARLAGLNKEQVRVDVGDSTLNGLERAARIARLLDAARARRDRSADAADGLDPAAGSPDAGL